MGKATVAATRIRKVCFFGGYTEGYPRHEVLRKGLEKRNVEVCTCRTSPRRRLLSRYAVLLYRYLKMKRDFDVIYVPEFRHKDVPLAYVLGRLTGKRVVFDPLVSRYDTKVNRAEADEDSFQAWHNRNLDRMAFSLCDLVLSDTQAHADYYTEELGAAPKKIRVLPVGFDEDLFTVNGGAAQGTPGAGPPTGACKVLFVGSYLPFHGVDVIVQAARLLRDEDIEFVLIGGGQTYDRVAGYVKKENLTRVRLHPNVPMRDLARHVADADISLGVFGRSAKSGRVVANKVFQSMAVGRPVITADGEAAREFFSEGENICLVPAGDARALAERIRTLAREPAMRADIGAAGARIVHERFSSRSIADAFLRYAGELLECRTVSGKAS
ncbi:MAG: glycosyltransferase [Candidatus Krumholzibacteriia bacterium]